MHPEVQKRAQIEVDGATGGKRLPLMSDREKLPYVNALVKELGRWYTVVPLGKLSGRVSDFTLTHI
jgi:cytochrome P450